jgi:hypothetical protein
MKCRRSVPRVKYDLFFTKMFDSERGIGQDVRLQDEGKYIPQPSHLTEP